MPLDDLYKKISVIAEFDIVEETGIIIGENSDIISEMIRSQLRSGKDSDGNEIVLTTKRSGGNGIYAARTIENKQYAFNEGKIIDRVTNYMTGFFYHSIFTRVTGQVFEQSSDVPYFTDIITQQSSGTKIMDLNAQNLQIFSQQILIPKLQQVFNTRFNGV